MYIFFLGLAYLYILFSVLLRQHGIALFFPFPWNIRDGQCKVLHRDGIGVFLLFFFFVFFFERSRAFGDKMML